MGWVLEWVADLGKWFHARELFESTLKAAIVYLVFFLAVILFESRAGINPRRCLTRSFGHDVIYTLFARGGAYKVLILGAVTNALSPHIEGLRIGLLREVPWPLGLALYWVLGDFLAYWWHRLQHANRFLWALHCVHHSQRNLNLFTSYRRHPLESLLIDVVIFFGVFEILLGMPTGNWLPLYAMIQILFAIQHAQLDWRFGPLSRIFVSPHFHSFHHSIDPAYADKNYGFLFSTWDYLFGTAAASERRPQEYGVKGIDFGDSLVRQLVEPFAFMWRWRFGVVPVGPGEDRSPRSARVGATSDAPGG